LIKSSSRVILYRDVLFTHTARQWYHSNSFDMHGNRLLLADEHTSLLCCEKGQGGQKSKPLSSIIIKSY